MIFAIVSGSSTYEHYYVHLPYHMVIYMPSTVKDIVIFCSRYKIQYIVLGVYGDCIFRDHDAIKQIAKQKIFIVDKYDPDRKSIGCGCDECNEVLIKSKMSEHVYISECINQNFFFHYIYSFLEPCYCLCCIDYRSKSDILTKLKKS